MHNIRRPDPPSMVELSKVLVVEDSLLLQKGFGLIFRRYQRGGCQVLHAYNGREALALLAEHPDCELMILDINMPVMSGPELLRHRKAHPELHRIPVIVITTEDGEAEMICCLQDGADAFLVKPFHIAELHHLIERLLLARKADRVSSNQVGSILF